MKYATEMGSGAMIYEYIPSVMMIASGIRKLLGLGIHRHTQRVSWSHKPKLNSVVLVRKRIIPTERPQPADEVSANFSC
jgi:hypothetical protein